MKHRHLQYSHQAWLEDIEYRQEFGSESAKLEIALALADARKTAGVTQAKLAELAEVSQAYIAKLERGDANPSVGKIAQLFACMWLKPFIGFRNINSVDSSCLGALHQLSTPQESNQYLLKEGEMSVASPDDIFGLGRVQVVDARSRTGANDESQTIQTLYTCEFVRPVLLHTEQLFFLLEAAELMAEQGAQTNNWHVPHAPPGLSLALMSTVINENYNVRTEMGSGGRLAQLAYRGWVALVAGTWERYRKLPPYKGKDSGLPMGMQASVFGDLQKIRIDVLKNGAVAAKGAEAKCEILKWFPKGEPIVFNLDHVIEFLNLTALLPTSNFVFTDNEGKAHITLAWRAKENHNPPPWRNPPYRVVSANPFIDRVEPENDQSDHGLFVRLAFADGLACTVLAEQSEDAEYLAGKKRAIEAAPRGGLFGLPLHPDLQWDVPATHALAKAGLSQGNEYKPPHGVGPAIEFGR